MSCKSYPSISSISYLNQLSKAVVFLTGALLVATLFACPRDSQHETDEITGTRIEISPGYTGKYFIRVYNNILLAGSYEPDYLCEVGEFVGDSLSPKSMLIKNGPGLTKLPE